MASFKKLILLSALCAVIAYGIPANQTQQTSILDKLKDVADCFHGIVSAPNAPEACVKCGVGTEGGAVSENKARSY